MLTISRKGIEIKIESIIMPLDKFNVCLLLEYFEQLYCPPLPERMQQNWKRYVEGQ